MTYVGSADYSLRDINHTANSTLNEEIEYQITNNRYPNNPYNS